MTATASAGSAWPPHVLGLAQLAHRVFHGEDLTALGAELEERIAADPSDAGALLDLGLIYEMKLEKEKGLARQAQALGRQRVFRTPATGSGPGLRLLLFVAPGDIATNVPVSFLLMHSDVTLDVVYLLPGQPLPDHLPEHDLAMVGMCESDANAEFLDQMDRLIPSWPRPVLLAPAGIRSMERDRLWRLLEGAPGVCIPPTVLMERGEVAALAQGSLAVPGLPRPAEFPFLLRPLDSHGGHGLERLDAPSEIAGYLDRHPATTFFFAPFVDYRLHDGLYRKYRVALVEGKPFLCHVAIAAHWMLHYVNADMDQDAAKRDEEARAFASFDEVFAVRHAAALAALYERTGSLEYITLDCAETRDGELLIFEAGTAMVVHDMDSQEMFPYKAPNMRKIFAAFRELLARHAA